MWRIIIIFCFIFVIFSLLVNSAMMSYVIWCISNSSPTMQTWRVIYALFPYHRNLYKVHQPQHKWRYYKKTFRACLDIIFYNSFLLFKITKHKKICSIIKNYFLFFIFKNIKYDVFRKHILIIYIYIYIYIYFSFHLFLKDCFKK